MISVVLIDPFFSLQVKTNTYLGFGLKGLKKCEGDCGIDSDCASGLKCFERHPWKTTVESAPGCEGQMKDDWTDYCYDPIDEHDNGVS